MTERPDLSCRACGKAVAQPSRSGATRIYCGGACRQRAHRRRRASAAQAWKEWPRSTAYPAAFVALLPPLREAARQWGYALAVHGSMQRDLDLIAVPWAEVAGPAEVLIAELVEAIGGTTFPRVTEKPHGRRAWSIYLSPDCTGPYLDVSVLPRSQDRG